REKVDVSLIDVEGVVTPTTFFLSPLSSDERAWLVEDCAFHYNAAFDELPDYNFAYLDIYEEHSEKRLALLQKWSQAKVRCFVNLSSSHHAEKVQQLTHLSSIDIVQMRRGGSVDDALAWGRSALQLCNAGAIVITLGSVGAVLVERQDEYFVAAEPIQPLRTIGAGASFSAGFLDALNGGANYREATALASKCAAAFCTSSKHPLEI
ncbi:MAG TPA: PfkB family carbohydrate kinase, partial [Ktedonobacteraceae bacterium]|nr:PfkB family carbohydrate kinase [Ktedonobacteraceae bacterium]